MFLIENGHVSYSDTTCEKLKTKSTFGSLIKIGICNENDGYEGYENGS